VLVPSVTKDADATLAARRDFRRATVSASVTKSVYASRTILNASRLDAAVRIVITISKSENL